MLHSKEITVKEASYVNKSTGKGPELCEISYHLVDTTLTLGFDDNIPLGEGTLCIKFDGILNGDMAGFYKSAYTDADGNKQIMASTQFEALDARRAFPCWDEPAIKATFAVTLVVPSNLTAVSNMPEISTCHLSDGKKRVIFDTSPKMSTYLLAWAIGQFDYVQGKTKNGVTIRVFSPPGRAQHGMFALDTGKRALDFYDDFFQVPYPLPKLDMICCTEFAMGAMENWGLVTYREVDLMIDEEKASSKQRQRVAIVVTHELAHQWFGNLVTMQWWNDLWLNEGFACYMEHFSTDALFPDYRIWEQYTTGAMAAALRLDSLKSSHPIQVPIVRAEEVEQVFDAISYCKGSTVVRMVAAILGPEKFRQGLQQYMQKYQYGNTVTHDLWSSWAEVSGIDIPAIMNTWTEQMGHPSLRVLSEEWTASSLTIELEQNWFLADGSSSDSDADKIWTIPLTFATSKCVSEAAVLMTQKRQTFCIPLAGEGDWVKLNAGQQALVRVAHTPAMIDRLLEPIRSKTLSPIDRASLLLDAYALAKAGSAPVEGIVRLLRAFEHEDNFTVWSAIQGVLLGLHAMMEQVGGDAYLSYCSFGTRIVKNALSVLGWEHLPTDDHSDKLLRTTVISLLDVFGANDEEIIAEARLRFNKHWEDPSALHSDFKATVYKIVLRAGGKEEYERVLKSFYDTDDNSEKKYAMYSLGSTSDLKLKQRTLDWAVKSGDVKLQDFFYPIGPVGSSLAGAELAWSYFKENVEFIKEKLAKASPSLMDAVIVNCIGGFSTLEQAEEVESYFKAHPFPKSERRIGQAVESIRNSGSMLLKVKASDLVKASFWE
eukprot:CAMPEP_0185021724 /NCGR_PEP_ID=MMETSP1103-20130426/4412_1 /TAXON_ID=36769 /ORGANISM="Paraphysomonas bandaiensis, Strain Caron Lab Isolate" /LENGTH=825 /DNA_ID=CAMNT_0027553425 /DNA_START=132 /DNA_END=2609 /DNA_ORIENTATION=+